MRLQRNSTFAIDAISRATSPPISLKTRLPASQMSVNSMNSLFWQRMQRNSTFANYRK